jgi:hypothetical protein
MNMLAIRQKLHDIIDNADDEKVEEMFIKLIDDTNQPYEWRKDEEFLAELEQISADMDSGKDKGFTLEESMAQLKARLKKNG